MKKIGLGILCFLVLGCSKKLDLQSEQQKLSYALGQSLAWQIKQKALSVDPELVADSLRRGLKGETPEIAYLQMKQILVAANPAPASTNSAAPVAAPKLAPPATPKKERSGKKN